MVGIAAPHGEARQRRYASILMVECRSNKNASRRPGVRWDLREDADDFLQLDHVELALGRTAFRTNPVFWNVGPSGAGREAFIRVTLFLVIDVAAGPALPGFIGLIVH